MFTEFPLEREREDDFGRTSWDWDDVGHNNWECDNDEIETSICEETKKIFFLISILSDSGKGRLTKVHPEEYYHFGVLSRLDSVLSPIYLPPVSLSVEMMTVYQLTVKVPTNNYRSF